MVSVQKTLSAGRFKLDTFPEADWSGWWLRSKMLLKLMDQSLSHAGTADW